MRKRIKKEEFSMYQFITCASSYPEFEEKFIKIFDSKEVMETSIKLTVDIESKDYEYREYGEIRYNYYNIIRDLGINYGIYKNEQEFKDDYCDDERKLEIDFENFYCNLRRFNKKFYLALIKNGVTYKQMYDAAFVPSRKYGINYDINKLVKKYEDIFNSIK